MWPSDKYRIRVQEDSDDDDLVTDCAVGSRTMEKKGDLIPREAKAMDKNPDQLRYDSHIDSGFNSFRSESYHSVAGDSYGYTRLQPTPSEPVNLVEQPTNYSKFSENVDLSSNTSSYSSSSSSEVSEKISRLNLAQGYLGGEEFKQQCTGGLFTERRCEAFQQDEDGDTLLHLGIIHCAMKIILQLINIAPHPAYLNLQNNLHQTPLHLAAMLNLPSVVRKLVVNGAILDVRDRRGNTALHIASHRGHVECVQELLKPITYQEMGGRNLYNFTEGWEKYGQPQDLELRNYEGQTCVHLATFCKNKEILKMLKGSNANINAQEGKGGRSALHFVVEMDDTELLEFLIRDCKADLNVRTFAGLTPIQFGYVRNTRMVHMLRAFGALDVGPPEILDYESSESDSSMEECSMVTDKQECDFMVNGQPLTSY